MDIRSLWLAGILIIALSGCISIKPSDISRVTSHSVLPEFGQIISNSFDSTQLYKATLDIRKHHLKGMLMIKPIPVQNTPAPTPPGEQNTPPPTSPQKGRGEVTARGYRFTFMNEIGMTFFDLKITEDSLIVISCYEAFSKKALLKILETDFRILTMTRQLRHKEYYLQKKSERLIVYGGSGKNYKVWQTYTPAGDTLLAATAKSTLADPVFISFDQYKNGFPLKITMRNPFIGLKLSLRKLATQ